MEASNKQAHTPGPWLFVGPVGLGTSLYQPARIANAYAPHLHIATVEFPVCNLAGDAIETDDPGAQLEGNVRLIAAAPDLLEALVLLEREMVESGNAGSRDYGWKPAISKTRSAIAKATGRAA